jgi:YfiH family protein
MWLKAPNLRSVHGFSTRLGGHLGGFSQGPYNGLNLSSSVGDDPQAVQGNRQQALEALGVSQVRLARLRQVHSNHVVVANPDTLPEADALVSREVGLALVIETADCYPVLMEDAQAGVIGAAHAGWRGTVAGVVLNTLRAMLELGARLERVQVAIGPGISRACYQIGAEVRERFMDAGFPHTVLTPRALAKTLVGAGVSLSAAQSSQETESKTALSLNLASDSGWYLDLGQANAWLLETAGVPRDAIWQAGLCSTDQRFFSYRRDQGRTGRMWAIIARPTLTKASLTGTLTSTELMGSE